MRDLTSGPAILFGFWWSRSRLAVEFILGLYAEGWTEEQILENYPSLSKEGLLAVFAYTRECMREEFLYPLSEGAI